MNTCTVTPQVKCKCFFDFMYLFVFLMFYRELLNAHRDNLGTMVKFVIFNELSNARNPNNMQVLHTVLQHSPEQAPKVTFQPTLLASYTITKNCDQCCFLGQVSLLVLLILVFKSPKPYCQTLTHSSCDMNVKYGPEKFDNIYFESCCFVLSPVSGNGVPGLADQ